jgi:hypothetical protein
MDLLQRLHGTSAILQKAIYDFLATKCEFFEQSDLRELSMIANHYIATNRQTAAHIQLVGSHLPHHPPSRGRDSHDS